MNKLTKTFLITILLIVLCFSGTSFANASTNDNTNARLAHTNMANFLFTATNAEGEVVVQYAGNSDSFARADVTVKLQKKILLFFWTDVDEWSASSTEENGIFSHIFTLNGTGTYKATFTLTVTGMDGTVDTVTKEIESKYSK